MKKSLALSTTLAAVAVLGAAGVASAAQRPAWGAATVWSDMSGSPAYYDEFSALVPGSASGDVTVEVDQSGVYAGPIVMADIDLGAGFTVDSVASVTIVSNEDSGSCSGTAVISVLGDTITAKGFSCGDTDSDGYVEFSLVADDIVASTVNTADGEYSVESQYRTNGSRRIKYQSWVAENETGIVLSTVVA